MTLPLTLVATLLLLTPPGTPDGGFRWQRTITPPPGAGTQQACVVLDAATFENAAPSLGDLRLFQDGTELPYVIEESYDERSLDSGTTLPEDRSEFETVFTIPLNPGSGGAGGGGELPMHVPVERMRLLPTPVEQAHVVIAAAELDTGIPRPQEDVEDVVSAEQPAFPVTIGANLQHPAKLSVVVDRTAQVFTRAILEMRRRSLCYQPRSAGPLVLYLGGGQGMAAKTYGLANGFSTTAERPYGTLGPLEPNADQRHPHPAGVRRLVLALTVAMGVVLVGLLVLIGRRDDRAVRGV